MSIWAVVPAKDPRLAKSRLAGVLSPEEREALSMRLLIHTLRVVAATPVIDQCLVVSESEAMLSLATQYGARGIREPALADRSTAAAPRGARRAAGPPDARLNSALTHAAHAAMEGGAGAVLVLAADLPLLTPRDLRQLPKWLPAGGGVVLIPDRQLTGTNALLMQPPVEALFQFGPDSLARHKRQARTIGLQVVLWSTPALRMDLDTPEDLAELQARAGADSPLAGIRPAFGDVRDVGNRPHRDSGTVHAGIDAWHGGKTQPEPPSPIDFAAAAQRLRDRAAPAE